MVHINTTNLLFNLEYSIVLCLNRCYIGCTTQQLDLYYLLSLTPGINDDQTSCERETNVKQYSYKAGDVSAHVSHGN